MFDVIVPQDEAHIVYTGTIYKGAQHPEKLFIAMRDLAIQGVLHLANVHLDFYGNQLDWLIPLAHQYGIENIHYYGFVSREVVRRKQLEANILLLLKWDTGTENDKGVLPGKTVEYLPFSAPILAIGGCDGTVSEIINETHRGVNANTQDEIKEALWNLLL